MTPQQKILEAFGSVESYLSHVSVALSHYSEKEYTKKTISELKSKAKAKGNKDYFVLAAIQALHD